MKTLSIFKPIPILLMFSLSMMLLLLSAATGMATPSFSEVAVFPSSEAEAPPFEQLVLQLEAEADLEAINNILLSLQRAGLVGEILQRVPDAMTIEARLEVLAQLQGMPGVAHVRIVQPTLPVLSGSNDSLPVNKSSERVEVDLLLDSNQLAELPQLLKSLQGWQTEGKVSEFKLVGQNRLRLLGDSATIEALGALSAVSEVVKREESMGTFSTQDGTLADVLPSSERLPDSSRALYAQGHDFLEEGSQQGKQATEATREYWLILELNHPMKHLSAELSDALAHLKGEGVVLEVEPTIEENNILKVVATTSAYSRLEQLPTVSAVALSAPPLSPRSRSNGGGTITGRVTAADGTPLEDIRVWVSYDYNQMDEWVWFYGGATNAEGEYTASVSESGSYRLSFYDPEGIYLSEYYDNASDFESATDIEVIAGQTTTGIDAQLDEGGHITGTLSDQNGNPIEDIQVGIYRYDEEADDWRQASSAYTTADGFYDASNLKGGSYRVAFEDWQGRYRSEFYDDVLEIEDGSDVVVTLGETTPNIDASLEELGHMTGTVLNDEGTPLPYIKVTAYENDQGYYYWDEPNYDYTDAQGQYDIGGLETGNYRVRFSDSNGDYLPQYYQNVTELGSATEVSVSINQTTANIDAQLKKAGRITGIVGAATSQRMTNPAPSTIKIAEHQIYLPFIATSIKNPLANIKVRVYQYSPDQNKWWRKGEDETDTNGRYDINGLETGTYRLVFFDPHSRYLHNYYKDGLELDRATDVEVVAGQITSRINQLLDEGGKIKGTVTDANNNPVLSTRVYAYHYNDEDVYWESVGFDESHLDGDYSVRGLETGNYRLCFTNRAAGYLSKCYDNVTDFYSAPQIAVTRGETSAEIDVTLDKGGEIHGTLTNAEGQPLPYIEVLVLWYDEQADAWWWIDVAETNSAGEYQVKGLDDGTYRLAFNDWQEDYLFEYYEDATEFANATDLSVSVGQTVTNIDAQLNDAGSISGVIRGADGELLTDAVAYVYRYNQNETLWEGINYAYTNSAGAYTINGLDSGNYRIRFRDYFGENLSEYYQDAADIESATDVSVTAGQTTTGIDGDLAKGGSITGVVRDIEGNPIENKTVVAYQYNADDEEWQVINYNRTASTGEYEIKGLHSGSYHLYFSAGWTAYLSQYYDNATEIESATDIEVTAGQATAGIDVELERGGVLTGTVTNANDEPLKGVRVYASRNGSETNLVSIFDYHSTNSQGEYEIDGLQPGSYQVKFVSQENYLSEYYQNASDLESSTTITVTANQTVSDIDAQLAEGGKITGIVTDADGLPLRWVKVSAYQYDDEEDTWQVVRSDYSNLYGEYKLEALHTGNYRLGFSDSEKQKHQTQYYDHVTDIDEALDLSVTAGETISDINASLDKAGRIIGQISNTNGRKLSYIRVTAYQYDEQEEAWQAIHSDYTNSQGYYNLRTLDTGSYRLHFQDLDLSFFGFLIPAVYAPEYYDNVLDLESATDVPVVVEQTTADIDAELHEGGRLRGTVSDASGNPLDEISVKALQYDSESNQWNVVKVDLTNNAGEYQISALNTGNYRLEFYDEQGHYVTEYYNNVSDIELAQDISLTNDETIENLDAWLDKAGSGKHHQ